MTTKKSNDKPLPSKPKSWKEEMPKQSFERKQYQDDAGTPRVVFVPAGETDLKTGIPLSLDLTPLFGHMPQPFQNAFYQALHNHGLIEPKDFFAKGAAERYQRALRDVIRHDFLNVQALAKEELNHAR